MNVHCEIIEDLLPLYADNLCSMHSKQLIENHLQACEKCKKTVNSSKDIPIIHIESNQKRADKAVKKSFRKIRFRWLASILAILLLIPFGFLGWNEYSAQGVAYSNQDELIRGNQFMSCLVEGNYEKAYLYLDVESKRHSWLNTWFTETELTHIEKDGLKKFCELGERLKLLGGIEQFEYVGTTTGCGVDFRGNAVHQITYKIRFQEKNQIFQVDISQAGILNINSGGNILTDPLAQFCIWGEYLWQEYKGCYLDPETMTYVYYNK